MARVTSAHDGGPAGGRPVDNLPLGYLRTFAVLLVLAHHAVLAYHPWAPPAPTSLLTAPRWWPAFPVVDSARSGGLALLVGWNDIFFMALLFFVSGLFVPGSLSRRGVRSFLTSRLWRLGLPFLFVAGVVAPLAYYPTYLATAAPQGVAGYAREWLSLGTWPAGPAWFLWVLLVFDLVVAGGAAGRPRWPGRLARRWSPIMDRPVLCFGLLVGLTAAAYLPLRLVFGPLHWTLFGPFAFQTARLLHYAVYFAAGIAVGAHGFEFGLLASDGRLARRWPGWIGLAALAFALTTAGAMQGIGQGPGVGGQVLMSLGFVVTCAASCFAMLALFLRFVASGSSLFDSLRANAYGMYVVHYAFATWLQYAILGWSQPGLTKGMTVFAGTVLASWATSAALRRLPAVRRIL